MKIKINFEKFYVTDNGDPDHETNGELYYNLKVNGNVIASQSKSNPKDVKDHSTVNLNKSTELELNEQTVIELRGFVGDVDKGFNGENEEDDFCVVLTATNNWKQGDNTVNLSDGRLHVTLHYQVEVDGVVNTNGQVTPKKIASVLIVSFKDNDFYKLVQNASLNYSLCFENYDKSVLIKKTYSESLKPTVHIRDTSKKAILDALVDLADEGFALDVYFASHGSYNVITLDDNVEITSDDIRGLATGKYAHGKFPIRMVYQLNCHGSTLNDDFLYIGAKAVGGTKKIDFYPNRFNKFVKEWNDGERFDTAINDSDTASARTVMQTLIVADSKVTKFKPACKIFSTVLGQSDCSEAYFTDKWLTKSEYNDKISGKDNMNNSSKYVIGGDAGLRKTQRPSW